MFHVRVFKKRRKRGFLFFIFYFQDGRHLIFFPTTVGVSTVQRHIKNLRDMLDKRAEHIYSVLIVSLCLQHHVSTKQQINIAPTRRLLHWVMLGQNRKFHVYMQRRLNTQHWLMGDLLTSLKQSTNSSNKLLNRGYTITEITQAKGKVSHVIITRSQLVHKQPTKKQTRENHYCFQHNL